MRMFMLKCSFSCAFVDITLLLESARSFDLLFLFCSCFFLVSAVLMLLCVLLMHLYLFHYV